MKLRYVGQIFFAIVLLSFVLLQTYCGPNVVPQEACGFSQNPLGQRISWKQSLPVQLYFESNFPAQYQQTVYTAINTWEQGVNGRKLFNVVGTRPSSGPQHDGINIIYWVSQNWDSTATNEQADTLVYWADNQLVDGDIVVNGTGQTFTLSTTPSGNQVDFESLILHELGHMLGLKHITEPSVMNPDLPVAGANGGIRRSLYPVDVADIHCEY